MFTYVFYGRMAKRCMIFVYHTSLHKVYLLTNVTGKKHIAHRFVTFL